MLATLPHPRYSPRARVVLAAALAAMVWFLFRHYTDSHDSPTDITNINVDGIVSLFFDPNNIKPVAKPPPQGGVPPTPEMLLFWSRLVSSLTDARPQTKETIVIVKGSGVSEEDIHSDGPIDRVRPNADVQRALTSAHAIFVEEARNLGEELPYAGKAMPKTGRGSALWTAAEMTGTTPSRGIVMTAGGRYVGMALASILMLRRAGSTLPVELFLDGDGDYEATLCETVLPRLGATCHVMERYWEAMGTADMSADDNDGAGSGQPFVFSHFQFKVFSMLFSSFQQLIFLDADCWPVSSPDALLAAEPFASRGLVTWPDLWRPTAAPVLYDIMGLPHDLPAVREVQNAKGRSSESGMLFFDKAVHAGSLLMAVYYNVFGPDYYYPLLSQGAHGQGDKETFVHGALVMGRPFYAVHTPVQVLGRTVNGTYFGAALRQADPSEDWRLAGSPGLGVAPTDLPKGTGAATAFIHHSLAKINMRTLDSPDLARSLYARDKDGLLSRLWGTAASLRAAAGYDVERAMWDIVRASACGSGGPSERRPGGVGAVRHPDAGKGCAELDAYYEAVFTKEESP